MFQFYIRIEKIRKFKQFFSNERGKRLNIKK